jgi:hypothetical protein
MLWANTMFLRDFTALERFSNLDLDKTAAILNDAYLFYDIAFRFLKEHNQRTRNDTLGRICTNSKRFRRVTSSMKIPKSWSDPRMSPLTPYWPVRTGRFEYNSEVPP